MIDRVGLLFDRAVAARLSKDNGSIYGYEDHACDSFVRAGDLGLATYYEFPTAYFAQKQVWLEQEVRREPELRPYFAALNEPKAKLERKARELSMEIGRASCRERV